MFVLGSETMITRDTFRFPGAYEACKDCDISGKYIGNAMRYPDAWYMLPENHEYRIHPETKKMRSQMAAEKTHEYILERASKVGELEKDNPFLQGIFGKSVFFNLQYFDVGIGHLTCFMHSLMNFGAHDRRIKYIFLLV